MGVLSSLPYRFGSYRSVLRPNAEDGAEVARRLLSLIVYQRVTESPSIPLAAAATVPPLALALLLEKFIPSFQ
jgi:hypothetical protein